MFRRTWNLLKASFLTGLGMVRRIVVRAAQGWIIGLFVGLVVTATCRFPPAYFFGGLLGVLAGALGGLLEAAWVVVRDVRSELLETEENAHRQTD